MTVVIDGAEDMSQWLEAPDEETGKRMVTSTLEQTAAKFGGVPVNDSPPVTAGPDGGGNNPSKLSVLASRYMEIRKNAKRAEAVDRKARAYPCPSCVAGKGEQCVSPAGNRLPELHISRIEQIQRHSQRW